METNEKATFEIDNAYEVLSNLLKRMETQDNRATASPVLFLLQTPKEVVADSDYSYDKVVYYHSVFEDRGFETREEAKQYLREYGYKDKELEEEIKNITALFIKKEWQTQNVFLTEEGYNRHLALNRHNYGEVRSYVIHGFRNPELKEMIDAIKTIVKHKGAT